MVKIARGNQGNGMNGSEQPHCQGPVPRCSVGFWKSKPSPDQAPSRGLEKITAGCPRGVSAGHRGLQSPSSLQQESLVSAGAAVSSSPSAPSGRGRDFSRAPGLPAPAPSCSTAHCGSGNTLTALHGPWASICRGICTQGLTTRLWPGSSGTKPFQLPALPPLCRGRLTLLQQHPGDPSVLRKPGWGLSQLLPHPAGFQRWALLPRPSHPHLPGSPCAESGCCWRGKSRSREMCVSFSHLRSRHPPGCGEDSSPLYKLPLIIIEEYLQHRSSLGQEMLPKDTTKHTGATR